MTNHRWRAALAALVTVALTAIGLTAATTASADAAAPAAPALPPTVTADALPTWQITGVVWSQVLVGNTVYATGNFTKARPPGMWQGGPTEITVGHLIAYDITTGQRVASFNHILNAQGLTVTASPDGSRVYVGGDFTTVDGVARSHIAAFDTATGNLNNAFAPAINGQVRAVTATNTTVYAGGAFESAAGVARNRLASFNAANGVMSTTWAPTSPDGYVYSLVLTPDKSKLIVGGQMTTINSTLVNGMGAVDAVTGASLPWAANAVIKDATNGAIDALKTDGTSIYGAGYAFGSGSSFEGTFSLDPATGNINWLNDCHGDTYDVQPIGSVVYSVSHAHDCTMIGSYPDTNPRVRWQHALATTNYATTTNQGPDSYGWNFNGQPASTILPWYPDLGIGTATGQYQAAWSVTGNSTYVALGGEFPTVNGGDQQGLTRFAVRSAAPNKVGPQYTTTPSRPTPATVAQSLAPGTARVSFGTAWDKDDPTLTYQLVRDNQTPVYTTTASTNFWTLPGLGFLDRNLVPGSTHTYQVKITDPSGNVLMSPVSNTVTVSSAAQSPYAQDVSNDGASHYWRLGEPSGTAAYDWTGFDDLGLNAGVTRGATGAINGDPNGASTFDGSTGVGVDPTALVGPNVFTEEAWFQTTSTMGGKIVSFGDQPSGNSGNYDRHIYMDPQGKVWFGVYNNGSYTVNSQNAANDGQWHHVVGTMDASGITMYLDGKKVGHNSGTSVAQPYTGYWRVGGDSAWNGNPYFNGVIDDVAIYSTALSIDQVQKHYLDSGRTLAIAPKPTDTYGSAVYGSKPDLYWRLDEAAGPVAKDTSPNQADGAYSGGVTYGVPGGVTGTTDTAVTLDGGSGIAAESAAVNNPTVYSEELWFSTTTTRGGKLIGFGDQNTGLSGSYDRHIYMLDTGQLRFGTYSGQLNLADSPKSYNDGTWHHMVATQGPDGMKLYVDGILVGTNPATQAQAYTGYWRVGGDQTWGGASSNYFAGSLDEVAVYSSVLDAATVKSHYLAGGGTVPNQPPVSSFTAASNGLAASFDGSGSSDPDGTVASYAWDFGDQGTATVAKPTHTYTASGTYTVKLTVTDDRGASTTSTQSVTVTNLPPVASFTSTVAKLVATFDGSASADPDGTVVSYAWDFGDQGTATVAKPSHTYAGPGTYTVALTVTDNTGAKTTVTHPVTVVANQPPVASFTSVTNGSVVTFDGSASSDPDGTVASYAWDFGDQGTATGAKPTHTYAAGGTFTVKLTVTDDLGATNTATKSVTVTANQPPVASFTSSALDLAATFDGSVSSDPDGTVASYAWDFGDQGTATVAKPSHTYAAPGIYVVKLTVTDDKGATNTSTKSVVVSLPFAKDLFTRTVANGWGSADTGGSWSTSGGASNFSVGGGVGRLVTPAAASGVTAMLNGVSSTSTDLQLQVALDKMPTGGGQFLWIIGRGSSTDGYRAKVWVSSTGTLVLYLSKFVAGAETELTNKVITGSYVPGDTYQVRLQVFGTGTTSLQAKTWKVGTTEPTTWAVTATDTTASLQQAGAIGLVTYLSKTATNAPITISVGQLYGRLK